MTITWQGVKPCKHTTRWMVNTKECFECWSPRFEKAMAAREMLPFESGPGDHKHWSDEIEATRADVIKMSKKKHKKAG